MSVSIGPLLIVLYSRPFGQMIHQRYLYYGIIMIIALASGPLGIQESMPASMLHAAGVGRTNWPRQIIALITTIDWLMAIRNGELNDFLPLSPHLLSFAERMNRHNGAIQQLSISGSSALLSILAEMAQNIDS